MKKDNRCRNDINYIIFIIKFISETGRVCCTVHCMLQCTGSNAVLVTIAYIHIFCSLNCESVDISTPRCRIITFLFDPVLQGSPSLFPSCARHSISQHVCKTFYTRVVKMCEGCEGQHERLAVGGGRKKEGKMWYGVRGPN